MNLVGKTRKREKTNFEWLVSNAISDDSFGLVSHFEQKNAQLWISRRS